MFVECRLEPCVGLVDVAGTTPTLRLAGRCSSTWTKAAVIWPSGPHAGERCHSGVVRCLSLCDRSGNRPDRLQEKDETLAEMAVELVSFEIEPESEGAMLSAHAGAVASIRAAFPGLIDARLFRGETSDRTKRHCPSSSAHPLATRREQLQ